jgi:hypothetical protein
VGRLSFFTNPKIMFEAFIEFLDQLYWTGYGLEFEEENPKAFYKQLDKFKKIHTQKR